MIDQGLPITLLVLLGQGRQLYGFHGWSLLQRCLARRA
jgi:hypothetical protein